MPYQRTLEKQRTAADYLPARKFLSSLRRAAENCEECELYKRATQSVFGEGLASASLVLIGEQPGDVEDRRGRPFVGPAGRLLDELLGKVGITRSDVYLTNAVNCRHFNCRAVLHDRLRSNRRLLSVRHLPKALTDITSQFGVGGYALLWEWTNRRDPELGRLVFLSTSHHLILSFTQEPLG